MQYCLYTVGVTNGSTAVLGETGTKFLTNASPGNAFKVRGDAVIYTIASVTDDTHLVLSAPYQGTTNAYVLYQITRDYTPNYGFAEINTGDQDWPTHLTQQVIRKIDEALAALAAVVAAGPTVTVTVPGAPSISSVTAGNGQAIVVLTAPASNGNGTITGYTVTSSPSGGVDSSAGTTALTHIVTGLTNGTSYTFTATATNSAGTGAASSASSSVTPQANLSLTVPGVPTSVTATGGAAQATVTFSAPSSNGGSAITGYTVTSSPGSITATGTTSPIIVTGLTNGTAYTFTVTATNSVGTGSASAASNSVTPTAVITVPGAPTSVVAAKGNAEAVVSFSAPSSNGGSAITGYTVTSSPGSITATGTASPITVQSLTNGTAYTFTVTATNAVGTGAASAASNSVTPEDYLSFTTTGTVFAPNLVCTGSPTIIWEFDDSTTSNLAQPAHTYSTGGSHVTKLRVTPWSSIVRLNFGNDNSDGSAFEAWPLQYLSSVSSFSWLAPYLKQWCSYYSTLTSLDFTDFTQLTNIECFSGITPVGSLTSVIVTNCTSLTRLVTEGNHLTTLDVSTCPNIEQIRSAQNYLTNINFGTTGSSYGHVCIHDNPYTQALPISQFINCNELLISNSNQSGAFLTPSTKLWLVNISGNAYTSADFTNAFTTINSSTTSIYGFTPGELDCSHNSLTSINLAGCLGIILLRANNNPLPRAQVDNIFATLDSLGRTNGTIVINNTNAPSTTGLSYASNLVNKGWTITLDGSTPVHITTTALGTPAVGWAHSYTAAASGGTGPYTWSLYSGTLPAGLSISSAGVLSGTPTTAGTSTFVLRAMDNLGVTSNKSFSLTVAAQMNLASLATVTVSSAGSTQPASAAVDGVIDGYPGDWTKEWATNSEGVGAWITLTWSQAYNVSQIILYDRPNTSDQITSGTITFSDSSTLSVGPLNNDGTATSYSFTTKNVTSLTLLVTGVSGTSGSVGLAEIQVY